MKPQRKGPVRLVLGPRQALLAVLALIFLLWSFAGITSLIGRIAFPPVVAAQQPGPSERVLLVDAPVAASRPSPDVIEVDPVSAAPAAEPESGAEESKEPEGRIYLRVATVNETLARVYAEYLNRRGIPAVFTRDSRDRRYWVMVGPLAGGSDLPRIRKELAAAGFRTR